MKNCPKYVKIEVYPHVNKKGAIVFSSTIVVNGIEYNENRIIEADFLVSDFDRLFEYLQYSLEDVISKYTQETQNKGEVP